MARLARKTKAKTETQTRRMQIIAPLFLRGNTYMVIKARVMEELGLKTYSLSTLNKDIIQLLDDWRKQRIDDTEAAIAGELQRIAIIQTEAWEAWEKSKKPLHRESKHQEGISAEGGVMITKVTGDKVDADQNGDPRYLALIAQQDSERRKLLGYYAPEKKEINGDVSFASLLMSTGITKFHIKKKAERKAAKAAKAKEAKK